MAQYIDKSAIVAEIDRRIEAHRNLEHWNAKHEFLKVKKFIDTLEVKEEVTTIDAFIEKVEEWLDTKDDRDYYTIGYIKNHFQELIKEIGL